VLWLDTNILEDLTASIFTGLWHQHFRGTSCLCLHWVVTVHSGVLGYQHFGGTSCLHLHWVVTLCSDVVGYQHFRGPCCLLSSWGCDTIYWCGRILLTCRSYEVLINPFISGIGFNVYGELNADYLSHSTHTLHVTSLLRTLNLTSTVNFLIQTQNNSSTATDFIQIMILK